MLTETEARELLSTAAATIGVQPGAPVTVTTSARVRRWLPALAAAVAVLVVVAGAALFLDDSSAGRPPVSNPTDTVAPQVGRIPSVFAYQGDEAQQLLADRGLVVKTEPSWTCGTVGRADRTEPVAGTRFEPGDRVTLFVTEFSPTAFCVAPEKEDLAWQLLDFANYRGPAPWFAPEVVVYLNGERTVLSNAEAMDVSTWTPESALGVLAAATRQEERRHGLTAAPELSTQLDEGTSICAGHELPAELAGRQSLWLSIAIPPEGRGPQNGCTFANVYQTDGSIDAIVVRTSGDDDSGNGSPEADPDPDGIGARFLAFARGDSDSLPVDTPVRLYLGGQYIKTIQAADVGDRSGWTVCPRFMSMPCQISALSTVRAFGDDVVMTEVLPTACLSPRSAKSPTDTGGSQMVVLGLPEPQTCSDAFFVQIWFNDVSQITAVNLLYGTT